MKEKVTGTMVYYYFFCKRKLWYFSNEINMESENESVILGKLLDEGSFKRDEKHINIDDTINIDFIREYKELHEVKKSKAIEEAGVWQTKYYLYYLKQRGVTGLKARIDYPLLKQHLDVTLNKEDEEKMKIILEEMIKICKKEIPPEFSSQKICKKCAYHDLCFI